MVKDDNKAFTSPEPAEGKRSIKLYYTAHYITVKNRKQDRLFDRLESHLKAKISRFIVPCDKMPM